MITVPTHKYHKSTFKHSKTICVFTSERVIVTVQIHSKNNGPLILERSRICTILLQDLMKRDVCWCGVEMLLQLSGKENILTREREKYKLFGVEPLPIFQGDWGTKLKRASLLAVDPNIYTYTLSLCPCQ
jgi:hypothetical protein